MTTTTTAHLHHPATGYTLPLHPLRTALAAVKPFADPKQDDVDVVRLHPGDVMHVYATDGFAAALAAVPISERDTDLADPISFAVGDVEKILAVFKMPADRDRWGNAAVRVDPTQGDEVTITDASGLFDGNSLTLPAHSTGLPDVRRMANGWLRSPVYREGGDWGVSQRFLGQLNGAAKTYGHPPFLHQRDRVPAPWWVATIGSAFVAGAMPVSPEMFGETETPEPVMWRRKWSDGLAGVGPWDDSLNSLYTQVVDAVASLRTATGVLGVEETAPTGSGTRHLSVVLDGLEEGEDQ